MTDEPPIKLTPTNLEEIRAREELPAAAKAAAHGTPPVDPALPGPRVPDELAERLSRLEDAVRQAGANTASIQQLLSRLDDLTSKVENLMAGLQGTVGYRAHQTFVCRKCRQQGNVAAKLNCTSCGEENLWGWWPSRQ